MTPKEKADEIMRNFTMICGNSFFVKEMSIFCVDEILKNFEGLHKPEYCSFDAIGERKYTFDGEYEEGMTGYDMISYWNEVRHRIIES